MTIETASSRFGELPRLELPSFLDFLKLKKFPLQLYPAVNEPYRPKQDTLYIYGPSKRTQGFDMDCLQMQIYLNFCGIHYTTYPIHQPEASPSGNLPFLTTVAGAVYNQHDIHRWLKERSMQKELTQHLASSQAFLSLIESTLKPAVLFSMWLEPLNADECTMDAYFGHLPWPVKSLVFFKKQKQVTQQLLAQRDVLVREEVYHQAAQTLEALSVKLGQDPYFFQSTEPTWFDAVVFSVLHCALLNTIQDHGKHTKEDIRQARTLSQLIRQHENLFHYVKSIHDTWFQPPQ
ncbi:hypothetical protein BY458DRAFT_523464 [Sporodiniella umbellata]|nr:hypothetical protein BY458DRAFT_523464 [Sporodiniella umbellata]